MEISITEQAIRFVMSCILGIALALLFDLMRIIRYAFHCNHLITVITDGIFSITALIGFVVYVMAACEGDLRLFLLIGLSLGALLYLMTLSKTVLQAGDFIVHCIKVFLYILFFPLIWIHKNLCEHLQKRRRKNGNFAQKEGNQ